MMFKLGLTGSIGMGKSTTAQMFAELGCVVWDADAAVHRLYARKGAAVAPIQAILPKAIEQDAVSRDKLRELIAADQTVLRQLEQIVHPLVQQDRTDFAARHPDKIGIFDIPLLFETGGDQEMDATVCVSISPEQQQERVLARGTMRMADLTRILARQMPNDEKCRRATYVIHTDTVEHARIQVQSVFDDIKSGLPDA